MNQSQILRDESIKRAEEGASREWLDEAFSIIESLAQRGNKFTTDDVWPLLTVETHEPRALGAVMSRAHRMGLIKPTYGWKQSTRPASHSRPLRVWEPVLT